MDLAQRAHGCLLGGAIGDALGAPVEFLKREEIMRRFGPGGIVDYAPAYGRLGAITDDTQMTLFTAEGVLRAHVRGESKGICNPTSVVSNAYRRWLITQGVPSPDAPTDGWLFGVEALHARRGPGNTCLSALKTLKHATSERAPNDSKGAGGIMRIAPWALYHAALGDREQHYVFEQAVKSAWITHGHPTGYLASGAFALILYEALRGRSLESGAQLAMRILQEHGADGREAMLAMHGALQRAAASAGPGDVAPLGEGWIAEEALAIALYCALTAPSTEQGIIAAVNITGDSDTTGSLAGQLLGAMHGVGSLPMRWLERLELRDEIEALAKDLVECPKWDLDGPAGEAIWQRYPGR